MPNTLPKRHVPVTASTIGTSSSSRPKESAKSSSEAVACNCSFQLISKIGQGGYGSVYLVEKNEGLDQKAIYAMKVFYFHHLNQYNCILLSTYLCMAQYVIFNCS